MNKVKIELNDTMIDLIHFCQKIVKFVCQARDRQFAVITISRNSMLLRQELEKFLRFINIADDYRIGIEENKLRIDINMRLTVITAGLVIDLKMGMFECLALSIRSYGSYNKEHFETDYPKAEEDLDHFFLREFQNEEYSNVYEDKQENIAMIKELQDNYESLSKRIKRLHPEYYQEQLDKLIKKRQKEPWHATKPINQRDMDFMFKEQFQYFRDRNLDNAIRFLGDVPRKEDYKETKESIEKKRDEWKKRFPNENLSEKDLDHQVSRKLRDFEEEDKRLFPELAK